MNRRSLPQFDELADWFLQRGAMVSPAELHGLLCGQIAAGNSPSVPLWLAQCEEFLGIPIDEDEVEADALTGFLDQVSAQFRDEQLGLRLLLPEDDCELAERVNALAQWCQGFLEGLTMAGEDAEAWEALTEETREALTDVAEIAQARLDEEVEGGDEDDYVQVSEYVRMVALHLHMELAPGEAVPAPADGVAAHPMAGLFGGDDRNLH